MKICPICSFENPLSAILCVGCALDLSFVGRPAPVRAAAVEAENEDEAIEDVALQCSNGHAMQAGDDFCLECGSPVAAGTVTDDGEVADPDEFATWMCGEVAVEVPEGIGDADAFSVDVGEHRIQVSARGREPDRTLQQRLMELRSPNVLRLEECGRADGVCDRWFERWDFCGAQAVASSSGDRQDAGITASSIGSGGEFSLRDLVAVDGDEKNEFLWVEEVARQLIAAIQSLHGAGVLVRDLNLDGLCLVKGESGPRLVIGDLSQAAVGDLGISREPTRKTPAFLAPEAAVGVYEEASDWWSLGALLLQHLVGDDDDNSAEPLNEQTLLLHVVTRGIAVPDDLPIVWSDLLKGLLTRDPSKRWTGDEAKRWLGGERGIPHFFERDGGSSADGVPLELGGEAQYSAEQWALTAASATGDLWDEASSQLISGTLGTWLAKREDVDGARRAEVDILRLDEVISDDERLAAVTVLLNDQLPLSLRGEVINPRWLLENVETALAWLEGDFPVRLARIDRVDWLVELHRRRKRARALLREKSVASNADAFRAASLVADSHQLHQRWVRRRRSFPVVHHGGLASLAEKENPLPEELVVLVSAELNQFAPVEVVLAECAGEAKRAGAEFFDTELTRQMLEQSHREIYRTLNRRLSGFVRCGEERLDEWADEFRFERHLSLSRALVLLQVPEDQWQRPAAQEYLGNLFEFFHRKILRGIQQGPLLRLRISKNSRNIDLHELDGSQLSSERLLKRIFSREKKESAIDPEAFTANSLLEPRIRRLHRVGVEYQRDTGIDSLYLGFPFLLFRPKASSVTAKPKRAPLFLWPVDLLAPGGRRGRVKIGYDHRRSGDEFESGGVELNPALQTLLKHEEIADLEANLAEGLARGSLDAVGVYEFCLAALPNKVGMDPELCSIPNEAPEMRHGEGHLYPAGALFLCDFSQQTVATDIRQLRDRGLSSGALARAMRLPGVEVEPSEDELAEEEDGTETEADRYFVLPADPSQQRAVLEARDPKGVVIQGPPGTGKSQTIVNILADCIGRGEKALVVCQKHAAIEVVAKRLSEEGLADRFFQIEDAKRSREPTIRALREQTEASAEWRSIEAQDSREDLAERIERLEADLCASADAIQRQVEPSRLNYAQILDRLIDGKESPRITAFELRDSLRKMSVEEVETVVESVGTLAMLWYRARYFDSPWHGLRDFSADATAMAEFIADLEEFGKVEVQRNRFFDQAGTIFQITDAALLKQWMAEREEAIRTLPDQAVADACRWRDMFETKGGAVRKGEDGKAVKFEDALDVIASESLDLRAFIGHRDVAGPVAELTGRPFRELVAASRRWRAGERSFLKRLLPGYWKAKGLVREFLDEHSEAADGGASPSSRKQFHQQIDWESARRSVDQQLRQVMATLGEVEHGITRPTAAELYDLAKAMKERLLSAKKTNELVADCPAAEQLAAAFDGRSAKSVEKFWQAADDSLRYSDTCQGSLEALKRLERWFSEQWIAQQQQQILQAVASTDMLKEMHEQGETLSAFQNFRRRFRDLPAVEQEVFEVMEKYRRELDSNSVDDESLSDVLRHTVRHEAGLAWKALAEERSPALLMDAREFEAKVKALRRATEQFRKATAEALQRPRGMRLISNAKTWMEILMLRGARALRLREVFDMGIDRGLFQLRPIWLASPETVSRVFPLRENLFDVVIFDEASQIPVELAVPSLYRARRAIISGDRQQLPPTNFFRSGIGGDADDDEENADEQMLDDGSFLDSDLDQATRQRLETKMVRREVKDCGDLLQLADADTPSRLLTIHYRSQWRHLIGFSNHAFYDAKLSVPVHHPDEVVIRHQPIEVRHIDSPYEKQINEGEAEAVIEFLAKHWKKRKPESVGVVTFNLKQADLIQDRIEERMETDSKFRRRCERERGRSGGEGFFVRNLENVQGDERDVIIFSTTFGPDADGRFLRNFGPASQRNGQRRLNVAITRSRMKMVIFTSMPIAEIASGPAGEGDSPREILKGYLTYAEAVSKGEFESVRSILARMQGPRHHSHDRSIFKGRESERAFVREVIGFLEAEGLQPKFDESHDAFHFDIALTDPSTGNFGLAIECDPPIHADLDCARAREIWRRDTMSGTIPQMIRLSSRAWFDDEEKEKKRLLAAVKPFR